MNLLLNKTYSALTLLLTLIFLTGCDTNLDCNKNNSPSPYYSSASPTVASKTLPPSHNIPGLEIWVTGENSHSQYDYAYDTSLPDSYYEDSCPPSTDNYATYYGEAELTETSTDSLSEYSPSLFSETYMPPRAGVLTAGSFNDAKNFDIFETYWKSSISNYWYTYPQGHSPLLEMPKFEDIIIEPRLNEFPKSSVDIAIVVDTTGSMSDELNYLIKEIEYISISVKTKFPNAKQRFSLIAYNDVGDRHISIGNHFTEDLDAFLLFLNNRYASGGGDYPEAMHTALEEANSKLKWSDQSAAKVLFLIADAPPHNNKIADTVKAIGELKAKGVHIYPVAASGVADVAERIMRYAALTTGGEYLFLTDDSGVSNTHAEPHIPCYKVAHLNELMILKIKEEIAQTTIELDNDKVIRSLGESESGTCE